MPLTSRNFPRAALGGAAALLVMAGAPALLMAQDNPGNKTAVEPENEGKALYEQICQACHMANANGGGGAGTGVPGLAGNPRLADKHFAIDRVWNGYGGMPRFGTMLSRAQVAAVLTYVRGHFNAWPDAVTVADVAAATEGPPPKAACNCTH